MPLGPPGDPDRFEDFEACVDALSDDPNLSEADAEEICGAWENRTNMKRKHSDTLTKRVDFVAKDEAQQQATGIVMVPDKVDLQGDYTREETIRDFADQFDSFIEAGEGDGGIMHAAWPSDWKTLERNEVLDEGETIGGVEAPAGAWVQTWQYHDDDLWSLVEDGILEGYSIGAVDVKWSDRLETEDELPDDVDVAAEYNGEMGYRELIDGLIREVSDVDIPAVPDAEILEAKDVDKRLADHLGNQAAFISEALERGHSEEDAERMWDVLNRALDVEGAREPGKQSVFTRAGKAFLSALTGSDDDRKRSEAPDTAKEGRTLSRQNRDSLYATVDAALDVLHDAGAAPDDMQRFTDREDCSFTLDEHTAREWPDEDDDEDESMGGGEVTNPIANDAPAGDTADATDTDTDTQTMSDDDPMADAPEWAKALNDRIDDLEAEKADEGNDDPLEDAPEWAKDLADRVDEIEEKTAEEDKPEWAKSLEERVDRISKQTGATESQQLAGAETGNGEGEGLGERQKFFIPESKRRVR